MLNGDGKSQWPQTLVFFYWEPFSWENAGKACLVDSGFLKLKPGHEQREGKMWQCSPKKGGSCLVWTIEKAGLDLRALERRRFHSDYCSWHPLQMGVYIGVEAAGLRS